MLVFALISVPTFAWKFVPLFSGNDLLPALLQSALSSTDACVCVLSMDSRETFNGLFPLLTFHIPKVAFECPHDPKAHNELDQRWKIKCR
jgi:hypothetical protein